MSDLREEIIKKQSINQFLVEASGGCWHEGLTLFKDVNEVQVCSKCKAEHTPRNVLRNPDFSKWKNFGELIEIARKHTTQITIHCPVVLKSAINIFTINSQTGDTIQNISTDDIPRIAAELIGKALGYKEKT